MILHHVGCRCDDPALCGVHTRTSVKYIACFVSQKPVYGLGSGAYVLTLGLLPEGEGNEMEGTCVLKLDEEDRKTLCECDENTFQRFMVTWGSHMQQHMLFNPYGALENWQEDKGQVYLTLFNAWTGWLLSTGPEKVPLVTEVDKRFEPLSDKVDASICMMIRNGEVLM